MTKTLAPKMVTLIPLKLDGVYDGVNKTFVVTGQIPEKGPEELAFLLCSSRRLYVYLNAVGLSGNQWYRSGINSIRLNDAPETGDTVSAAFGELL